MGCRIIRMKEVVERVGLSRSTVWRLESAGKFPARVRLSAHAVGYYVEAIDAWAANRPTVVSELEG